MMMSNRPLFDHKLAKLSLSNSRMIVHFTQYCKLPPCIIHSEQIRSKVFDFRFNDNQKVSSPSQKKLLKKSDLKMNTTLMNTVTKRYHGL